MELLFIKFTSIDVIVEFKGDNKFTFGICTGSLEQFKLVLLFITVATDSFSFGDKVLLQFNDGWGVIKDGGFDIIC